MISSGLVREVIKTIEVDLINDFDDKDSKPISAAFTGIIKIIYFLITAPITTTNNIRNSSNTNVTLKAPLSVKIENIHKESKVFSSPKVHGVLETLKQRYTGSPTSNLPSINSPISPIGFPSPTSDISKWNDLFSLKVIEEMVDKTFKLGMCKNSNEMSFEEYKFAVQRDVNLIMWFEALGTIF